MKKKHLAWAAFLILQGASFAGAQENVTEVSTVEVTGSRIVESIEAVPTAAYVVTSADIGTSGARNIQEVLNTLPGVIGLQNSASMAQAKGLVMRGLNTELLLLVDGVSQMNASYGTGPLGSPFDLRSIPLESIERIEVIKGASSALYGSHAAAGVINVITRKGNKETSGKITAEVGNADWFKGTVEGTASGELFNATLRYSHSEEGKTRIRQLPAGGYDHATDFDGDDVALRLEGGRWSAILEAGKQDSTWDFTNTWMEKPETTSNRQENEYRRFQLHYADEKNSAKLYYNANNRDVEDSAGFSNYRDNSWGASYTRRQKMLDNPAAFGFEFKSQNSRYANWGNPYGDDTPYDLTRSGIAPFGEISIPLGDLNLDLGMRYEYWDVDMGDDVNEWIPRLALSWETPTGKFWYLTGGRFFVMPSFYQMFLPARAQGLPNPGLQPEKGWTIDFGTRDSKAKNPWSLGVFYMDMEDKINYQYDPTTWVGQYVNVNEYRAFGIEGDYTVSLGKGWQFNTALSWTDAEMKDRNGSEWKRSDMPRFVTNNAFRYNAAPWDAEISLQTLHDRSIQNPAFDDETMYLVNTSLGWEKGAHKVRLACTNLFDKDYVIDNEGYLTAERRFALTYSFSF